MSVRLVQCVAQKGGVLSNPATDGESGEGSKKGKGPSSSGIGHVRAHPIVGWKGFDDVLASLPGETIDINQNGLDEVDATGPSVGATRKCIPF